jgi:Zn-finger nucleic acid-binding protein
MNRVNFGVRSGVVIDKCVHGIWLDSGELRKLLEWRKAGGQLYHETVITERLKQEELIKRNKEIAAAKDSYVFAPNKYSGNSTNFYDTDVEKLVVAVAKVIWKLFT